MNSTDQTILSCLLASLTQGEQPWLVTVIATIGSSPRPVGSLVTFRADGSQVGSVSGGCVEEDLIARLLAGEFNGPQVYLTDYGVSAEDNEKWGLPCGGRLELAIQQLDEKDLEWVTEAYNAMSTRQTLSRSVSLESGETQISPAEQFAPLEKKRRHIDPLLRTATSTATGWRRTVGRQPQHAGAGHGLRSVAGRLERVGAGSMAGTRS
jgi:xanthine dehydrogenase accessory factor